MNNQNPLLGMFQTPGAPAAAQQPTPGTDPGQFQLQQGLAQLQGLTQIINQKHNELMGLHQHHTNLRNKLGL